MIGVAAKAPPAAKTKAKGKGEAPAAEGKIQTTLKSDPFAPPHDHDSAFQGREGGGGGGGWPNWGRFGSHPDFLSN
jgi:hypothetical protein